MKYSKILVFIGLFISWTFIVALFITGFIYVQDKGNNLKDKGNNNLDPISQETIKLTLSEVSLHNTLNDCWMIIDNKVYDITPYTSSHPGGAKELLKGCGIDASILYSTKDKDNIDHSKQAKDMLKNYFIGDLNTTINTIDNPRLINQVSSSVNNQSNNTLQSPTTNNKQEIIDLTLSVVAKHNSLTDCWMIIENKVYDITPYSSSHPGGTGTIDMGCGKDATTLYNTKAGKGSLHSTNAQDLLAIYLLGDLNSKVSQVDLENKSSTIRNSTQNSSRSDYEYEEDEYEDDD